MSQYCSNCGTENTDTARFCASCGNALPGAAAAGGQEAPPAGTPQQAPTPPAPTPPTQPSPVTPPGTVTPAAPTTPQPAAAPPTTPQAAVPPATAPGDAGAPPGVFAPAPGASMAKGKTGAIVAVAAVVVLLAGGLAAWKLLSGGDEPAPAPAAPQTEPAPEAPETEPSPETETQPAEDGGGSLNDFVQQQVGAFTLNDAGQDPELITNLGAADGITMNYQHQDGTQLVHNLLAFSSPDEAVTQLGTLGSVMVDQLGYTVQEEFEVTDQNGQTIGSGVVLTGPSEVVLWTNGQLGATAEAPSTYATQFYNEIPY